MLYVRSKRYGYGDVVDIRHEDVNGRMEEIYVCVFLDAPMRTYYIISRYVDIIEDMI